MAAEAEELVAVAVAVAVADAETLAVVGWATAVHHASSRFALVE